MLRRSLSPIDALRVAGASLAAATIVSAAMTRRGRAACDGTPSRSGGCTGDPNGFVPHGLGSTPFWLSSERWPNTGGPAAEHARHTSPSMPEQVDVVIIGAGLSGAGATYSLAQRGVSTLLLDARGVSGGASCRNGGFLGGATLSQMPVMLFKMPLIHAYQTIRLKLANLCFIREFVSKYHVDCDLDYEVDGCSYYATEEEFKQAIGWWHYVPRALLRPFGVHIMEGSSEMREQLNLKPRDSGADGSGPRNAWGCIRLKKDYDTICAARFVLAVVDQAIAMGAHVFTHTRVEAVEPLPVPSSRYHGADSGGRDAGAAVPGFAVKCADGTTVRCNKVVYATNAYTGSLCPVLADKIRPVRNHVLVTTPAPSILKDGSRSGSGSNSGFNYWIQREDGRIVLGGFRDKEPCVHNHHRRAVADRLAG